MDSILNDSDDFDGFLDLPNEFPDDILLDDLDTLDFINDLDGNLIYDCDIDSATQPAVVNDTESLNDIQLHSKVIINNNTPSNYYRNCVADGLPLVFKNNTLSKENNQGGNTMIRELLSSDNGIRNTMSHGSYVSVDRFNDTGRNYAVHNAGGHIRTNENRNIIPKHPIILPATTGSSGQIMRTPTLAATLIGIQPSSNDNMDAESSSYGSGKVVRRNSHNAIEKRYRLSINDRIDELRHMLSLGDNSKMNKSAVLRKAVERIRSLEQENNSLKCDNYNLRKSIASGSSIESLNHTGSSPLSNQSDSGHSITNSPSSSSMHSTSVSSSFLFCKNNETQPCFQNNPSKGVKRPLIYDNNVTTVKTEKLARLLLSSSESYDDKYSGHQIEIRNDHSQNKKLHSSNMPSFLLCTMALFMVAFQPFDIVLNNYRTKVVTVTGARRLFSDSPLTDDLGLTVILAMSHWLFAFILIRGSTNNRYFLTKVISFLLDKARSMTFVTFQYNTVLNGDTVDNVDKKLSAWHKDSATFDLKLKDQLRLYHCECPRNLFLFVVELCAISGGIVAHYLPWRMSRKLPDKEAHKIAMSLVTCAVEQATVGVGFSRLESLWYKAVLLLIIQLSESDDRSTLSKLIIAQSIPVEFIRKYFVNKHLGPVLFQGNSLPDKYRCLLSSSEMRKVFVKNSLWKVQEKLGENCLMMPESSDAMYGYYVIFVQDALGSVVKKLLSQEVDCQRDKILKDIVETSLIFLGEESSRYVNTMCNFVAAVKISDRNQYMADMVDRLLLYYSKVLLNKSFDERRRQQTHQMVLSLKLFLSTMNLYSGHYNDVHEANLSLISSIVGMPVNNFITRLFFDTSIDAIICSLNGKLVPLARNHSDIYYADRYASMLRDYSEKHSTGFEIMTAKLNALFQRLCQLNPIKSGVSNNECKEQRKFDTNRYRVTEFLSLDGIGLREYNNSKMRSH